MDGPTVDEPAVPTVDGGLDAVTRVRLDIAYDGTDFSGWARQPGRRTVQEVLEAALATLLRAPVALTVAGRTDAGVHATGQVAHLDLPRAAPPTVDRPGAAAAGTSTADAGLRADPARAPVDVDTLERRLRRLLPPDVAVYGVRVVPRAFDARFGALRRHYAYRVVDRP